MLNLLHLSLYTSLCIRSYSLSLSILSTCPFTKHYQYDTITMLHLIGKHYSRKKVSVTSVTSFSVYLFIHQISLSFSFQLSSYLYFSTKHYQYETVTTLIWKILQQKRGCNKKTTDSPKYSVSFTLSLPLSIPLFVSLKITFNYCCKISARTNIALILNT